MLRKRQLSICCPFETKKPRTKIETFAEQHRLKVTRDECNAPTIPGRRGHPYFDGAELCLMVLDGKPAIRSKMEGAGRQAVDGGYQQERPRRAGSGRENHRMNAEEFVTVVKLHERRSDTLKVLERPPGRSPSERLLRLSRWYNQFASVRPRDAWSRLPSMPFSGFSAYWMVA